MTAFLPAYRPCRQTTIFPSFKNLTILLRSSKQNQNLLFRVLYCNVHCLLSLSINAPCLGEIMCW